MVTIDTREKPADYVARLLKVLGEGGKVGTLRAGDYLFCSCSGSVHSSKYHTLVERKRVGNLVSSFYHRVASGRRELADQLGRCKEDADRVVLLVEGDCRPGLDPSSLFAEGFRRKMAYVALQGILLSLQHELGVEVLWTADVEATIAVIAWLDDYLRKPQHGGWFKEVQ